MNSRIHVSELGLFELDVESRKMSVLEAVLKSVEGESATAGFKEIFEIVNANEKDNLSKSWIYKCLGELEQERFVVVDRISTPNKYMATKETIAKALESAKKKQMGKLRKRINEKKKNEDIIRNASIHELARELAGKYKKESREYSQLIEGSENVRSLLVSEILDAANQDSVIRVSNSSSSLATNLDERGPVEVRMLERAINGVEIRVLFSRRNPTTNEPKSISSFMNDTLPLLGKAVSSGRLKLRVIEEDRSTYRSLIRNQEKMILYLSDTYKADAAFLISNQDNETLIQQNIKTFDKRWKKAADITDMMKRVISSASSQANG
ncbi:MAG: hypothetical protein KGY80_05205 [Candidatus Thorarchaeota archaeon]|nr:hypothetical protein [Candidatus Thorarchaeota archaeon]